MKLPVLIALYLSLAGATAYAELPEATIVLHDKDGLAQPISYAAVLRCDGKVAVKALLGSYDMLLPRAFFDRPDNAVSMEITQDGIEFYDFKHTKLDKMGVKAETCLKNAGDAKMGLMLRVYHRDGKMVEDHLLSLSWPFLISFGTPTRWDAQVSDPITHMRSVMPISLGERADD